MHRYREAGGVSIIFNPTRARAYRITIERLQLRHNNDVIRARELRGVQPCGTWGSTTALLRPVKFTH